jgi:CDP-diacylglycerol--glycerol-3-phosphate 3-phosphatidyltransferase
MPFNIPNLLTWLRILLIPVFVSFFYLSSDTLSPHLKNVISTSVFLLAAGTDWLDGYMARKLNQFSAFGAFLDPVADKLMVADHRFHYHRARDHHFGIARVDGTAWRRAQHRGFDVR